MNWLDIVLIVIVVGSTLMGFKRGLIGAAIGTVGGFVGWLLAGQYSDDIGTIFDSSVSNDTIVTVVSYVIIIAVALVVAGIVARIVRPLMTIATLGLSSMVDKLGGLALGFILGLAIAGALILAMARMSYDFELPDEGIAGKVSERIPRVDDARETVENALIGSSIVSAFINVSDAIPGNALGFVPSDFKVSLDILEEKIDADAESSS